MLRATIVMPVLFVFVFLWHALPVWAKSTAFPEPVVKDPAQFPRVKEIHVLAGSSLSEEEADVFRTWIDPFMDELPDKVSLWISRSEPDRWMRDAVVRIFLLEGVCMIGSGTGLTFEKATENLARNLLNQGYLIREWLVSINPPRCKPE